MPASAASPTAAPAVSAAARVLAAGKTSQIDAQSGRLQELRADCPTDGTPAAVRRVTREQGGAIAEVTLRCPRCYTDFIASHDKLYLS